VQTKDDGKHAILPVAGQPDHAGLPVTLPRESDGNMRRDGSDVVWLLQPSDEKSAVDERGGVHGAPELSPVKELLAAEKFRVDYRATTERRRCRRSRRTCTRLRALVANRSAGLQGHRNSKGAPAECMSMDETSICVVDHEGKIIKECKAATEPVAIYSALQPYVDRLHRVGLEAQSFSPWLFKELTAVGLPVIVVEAVHMQKALSAQRNKTDRNDARGIAYMMRVGWFRQVRVRDDDNQRLRVLLSGRQLLKRKLVDIENELRGSLKAFGIKIGAVSRSKFEAHTLELVEAADPLIRDVIAGMLAVRRTVWSEYKRLHNTWFASSAKTPYVGG